MKKIALPMFAALLLSGCGLVPLITGISSTPPTAAPMAATSIDENAIDFARDSFDAALFGVDALMDMGRIKEGSPEARSLAKLIRQISGFLGAADAAQKAGQSATYNEAFRNAKAALAQFRAAIGVGKSASLHSEQSVRFARLSGMSLSENQRLAFADALEARN